MGVFDFCQERRKWSHNEKGISGSAKDMPAAEGNKRYPDDKVSFENCGIHYGYTADIAYRIHAGSNLGKGKDRGFWNSNMSVCGTI